MREEGVCLTMLSNGEKGNADEMAPGRGGAFSLKREFGCDVQHQDWAILVEAMDSGEGISPRRTRGLPALG
jgi:hypothetical protein